MRIVFKIAGRYLFSRSTTHLINIITGLSIAGLATGACVLILVMSVFNGLESTILDFFNKFNPDVKVEVAEGKTFEVSEDTWAQLESIEGVEGIATSLEEIVLFEHEERREIGRIKGVSENFHQLTQFDSTVIEGEYNLSPSGVTGVVAGVSIGSQLDLNVLDPLSRLRVYALTPESTRQRMGSSFNRMSAQPTGLFSIQQEYDQEYIFAPLDAVQKLLDQNNRYSSLEIKLSASRRESRVIAKIQEVMGADFTVSNRYEQEEEFLRLMRIEKWLAFLMLSFASLLVAFNMVGALWLIVLDKRQDLSILKCMGMTHDGVQRIVLTLGGYIAALGLGIGIILAGILYYLQTTYSLVGVPESFAVNAYPVEMRGLDILLTAAIIIGIGLLAAWPAALRAKKIPSYIISK